MKVGIVIFSNTGNTLSVAQKLKDKLSAGGHLVDIIKISDRDSNNLEKFDTLIFGSPVQGFSLAVDMKKYLSKINSLAGKKAACFVTQQLKPIFGGNRAIKQMSEYCKTNDADIVATGIIKWENDIQVREKKIVQIIDAIYSKLV